MTTLAVLPVKSFSRAKQRLEEIMPAGPRRALAEAMFADVITALRRTPSLDAIVVVSADHGAQRLAGGHGATVLDDHRETGQSAATELGIDDARKRGFDRVLLVPGDCPTLDPQALESFLGRPRSQTPHVTIVPDRHGTGTNALLIEPPEALHPAFGPGSRERHVEHAEAAGIPHAVVEVPTLGLDVDTAEDLAVLRETLAGSRGGAAHTRGMLGQLDRSRGSARP